MGRPKKSESRERTRRVVAEEDSYILRAVVDGQAVELQRLMGKIGWSSPIPADYAYVCREAGDELAS